MKLKYTAPKQPKRIILSEKRLAEFRTRIYDVLTEYREVQLNNDLRIAVADRLVEALKAVAKVPR
jgi:hypothetical protein